MWVVYLLFCALTAFAVALAWGVRHQLIGGTRLGSLGDGVLRIAEAPGQGWRVMSQVFNSGSIDLASPEQRFGGLSGFAFSQPPGSRSDLSYLLLNRYDGDLVGSVSELWDLSSQKLIHRWTFRSVDEVWRELSLVSRVNLAVDASSRRFRNVHASLTRHGELITQAGSPLLLADACSKLRIFQGSAIFHHSIEATNDESYWVPIRLEPKAVDLGSSNFVDDGLALVSAQGEVVFQKSVVKILEDNGLGALVFGSGTSPEDDPIHLNDIEPVKEGGRFWKKGDIFLSLRHQSMIILYRPSTNKILWFRQGPWVHQHDVNILNDHQISVFNNNAYRKGATANVVRGVNELMVYDFETETVSSPWRQGFEKLDIRTIFQGRGQPLGDEVFVEETTFGRAIQFDKEGNVTWQYVNRASDGKVYMLNWSRLVSRELGDKVKQVVEEKNCK